MSRFKENIYSFVFAAIVSLVCSLALTAVSQGLKEKQKVNMVLDKRKNILNVVKLESGLEEGVTAEELLKLYKEKIREVVVNDKGVVLKGKDASVIDPEHAKGEYPLYIYKEKGRVMAYAFPIVGKGLWSTIYGYLAIEPDGKTVRGITFYQQGETPGLGAEIASKWFQKNFEGKKIWDDKEGKTVPIRVVKGKLDSRFSTEEASHLVDGISGATLTGKGVTRMLKKWVKIYDPFLERVRKHEIIVE